MTDEFAPLPSSLRSDPNYQALNRLLDQAASIDLTSLLIYWLDTVDASALPHIARQFHIMGLEGWDYANTEAEKRSLLKQAVELHRYKGTPWGLRQGIQRIDPSLNFEEWYEYEGRPFYFRLTGGQDLTISQAVKLFHTIEALKNARSRLDGGITGTDQLVQELKLASRLLLKIFVDADVREPTNTGCAVLVSGVLRLESSVGFQRSLPPYITPPLFSIGAVARIEVIP